MAATSKVFLGLVAIVAFIVAVALPAVQAQAPAPAPTSDGPFFFLFLSFAFLDGSHACLFRFRPRFGSLDGKVLIFIVVIMLQGSLFMFPLPSSCLGPFLLA